MAKVEKTYKEIIAFEQASANYFVRKGFLDPKTNQFTEKEETKAVINLKNIGKQWKKLHEEFQEKVQELQLEHCLEDEKTKKVLRNEDKSYAFSKEGERKFSKAYKDLLKETVTIHQRLIVGENDFNEEEKEAFSGFVIPEIQVVVESEETLEP